MNRRNRFSAKNLPRKCTKRPRNFFLNQRLLSPKTAPFTNGKFFIQPGGDPMKQKSKFTVNIKIDNIFQQVLNISLIVLSIILSGLLIKEVFHLISLAFFAEGKQAHIELLESILVFFLYFEFIAMAVKYFRENYHFPLRYFMYIGITAMIRLIVVDHDDARQTLLYTFCILVLVISYILITFRDAKRRETRQ